MKKYIPINHYIIKRDRKRDLKAPAYPRGRIGILHRRFSSVCIINNNKRILKYKSHLIKPRSPF